ncbi:SusC/RagA family TonB-linked outer membrane protein [Marinigracilibium pacificum]|uniref:TonB-dependent receptor n=1 Tax=Marinigracilibium pacificum TaxID=2729599 RepID=A0A848J903_9BACT|nr:TonB-dependent receptor [Marinigracilibium pacificum]NMM49532.1 TonB-dependent receptor [Marinigracilibium pacificum]
MIKHLNHKLWYLLLVWLCTTLTSANVYAQTVSGTVTDSETGETLPGATILVQGTDKGTVTDANGKYSLPLPDGQHTLHISFVGYISQQIQIQGRSKIDVSLQLDISSLSEVVVVGYGTQKKKDVTGAVSSIDSKDLNQGAITNPLQQISGKAAGVNINQIGSEPGSSPNVRIRGITSLIGGNDPLVVVDGIQGNMDLLNQVPPSEIESIDILKDASATAIYGSRGAPGVIIITTKSSKEGKTSVEYSATASMDFLANKLDIFSADQWREQADLWGVPVSADHGSDTDWYDLLTQTGNTQNHTISFGGGSSNFNYRASVSAILQDGVVINSSNDNYIARIQATQRALDDKLTLTINLNNSIRKNIGSPGSVGRASFTSNLITNTYVSKPTDPVLFSDGSYYFDENVFQYINPYAVAETIVNESETHTQFGSLKADLELIEGLTLGWFGSWRKVDNNSGYFAPSSSTIPFAVDNDGVANVNTNLTDEKLMDISINYKKSIDDHSFNILGVYEWQGQVYQGHFAQAKGFINDITTYNALQLGSIDKVLPGDISSYKNDRKLVSFLGRLNYTYADKYIFTASVRRDGSSVFGADHKWGTFPSASLAWILSNENFIGDKALISNLKLRVGYGVTGNQQGLYPQQSLQLVGYGGTTYFGGELINNYVVTQNANSNLRWETRYQTNVGIDFGFFDDKLTGTIDAYSAVTKNLLFNYTVPQPPYPYDQITANVGSLKNEGIEFSLFYNMKPSSDLSITLGGNFTLMRNEVLELGGNINGINVETDYVSWGYNSFLVEGQPIGSYYILQNDGKDADTNEELVADLNGDGIIDQSSRSEDRYYAGNALPTYTFAFTPSLKYKNFDLSMVWRGSGGNKIYNKINKDFSLFENLGKSNMLSSSTDLGLYTTKYESDLWLEDGSFVRFENLTVGYTFDTQNIKYVNSLRLSLTGNNLLLFTKYTGLDPELNLSGGNGSGYDAGMYPRTRSVALGLNVSF